MKFGFLIEPPFNYRTPEGRVVGCDVDIAREVCDALKLGPFEPIETEFASLLPGLETGAWQMTTGMLITDERRDYAVFTRPIWALADGLLIRSDKASRIQGYRSIVARPSLILAVVSEQEQHKTAKNLGVVDSQILTFSSYHEAASAVSSGRADAFASIDMAHRGFLAHRGDLTRQEGLDRANEMPLISVLVPSEEKPPSRGGFALPRREGPLLKDIDAFLKSHLGSDSHRQSISKYGFSEDDINHLVSGAA